MNKIELVVAMAKYNYSQLGRNTVILAPNELRTQVYKAFIDNCVDKKWHYTMGSRKLSLFIDEIKTADTYDTVFIVNPQKLSDEALNLAKRSIDFIICVKI